MWNMVLGEGARERVSSQWKIRARKVNYTYPFRPSLHATQYTAPPLYLRFHIRANTPTPVPTHTKHFLIPFLTDIDSWDARK